MVTTTIAAALWQEQDVISGRSAHLLMIFIGVAAFALLAQALVMAVMAVVVWQGQKRVIVYVEAMTDKVEPLLLKTNNLVTDLGPQLKDITAKISTISGNVDNISGLVREKLIELSPTITAANETAREANETVREVNIKTRQQLVRVDGMVTGVLDATAQVGRIVQHAIDVPVREAAAIVDGIRTAVNTFIKGIGRPTPSVYRAPIGTYTPALTAPPRIDPYPDPYPGERLDLEP